MDIKKEFNIKKRNLCKYKDTQEVYLVEIHISDNFFSIEEKEKLMILLRIHSETDFLNAVGKVALASLTEYKEMLLGNGLPTRADEIKQHRLLHLVKHYFLGTIPTEAEVSSMFQLTESESRSLIRNVRTRFRYQLESEIFNTLRATVNLAEQSGTFYKVVIQSDNVLEELNRIIAINAPNLDPITKSRNSARQYEISLDSYELLVNHFNLQAAAGDETA